MWVEGDVFDKIILSTLHSTCINFNDFIFYFRSLEHPEIQIPRHSETLQTRQISANIFPTHFTWRGTARPPQHLLRDLEEINEVLLSLLYIILPQPVCQDYRYLTLRAGPGPG